MCLPFSYNFTLPVLPKAFAMPDPAPAESLPLMREVDLPQGRDGGKENLLAGLFSALFAQAATPGAQVDIKRRPRENHAPSSEAAWDAGILPAQPEVMIMLRKEMGGLADPSTVSPFVRPPIPCPGRGMEGMIWDRG